MHNVIINKKKILIHWMMQFSRNNAHYELALRMRTETLDDRQFIPVWEKKCFQMKKALNKIIEKKAVSLWQPVAGLNWKAWELLDVREREGVGSE